MRLDQICETAVVTASPEMALADAAAKMRRRQVGALVVTDTRDGGVWPIGIITDRDIAMTLSGGGECRSTRVAEVMSRNLIVAGAGDDFFDALSKMRRFGIRRLPVVGPNGRLQGIITLDDMVDFLSAKLREAAAVVPRERRAEARLVRAK